MTTTNPYIETFSGRKFEVYPSGTDKHGLDQIHITDIAHAQSMVCRYTGHAKRFYCPTLDQKILKSDLTWVEAGSLKLGDELLAFDENVVPKSEHKQHKRKLRPAVVTHFEILKRECVKITLQDGTTLKNSLEHPWLVSTKQSRNKKWVSSAQLLEDFKSGRKRYFTRFIDVWSEDTSRNSAWLAGMFDGEGSISTSNRSGVALSISQKPGIVLDKLKSELTSLGYSFRSNLHSSGVCQLDIIGGLPEAFKLLGSIRPIRLIDKVKTVISSNLLQKVFENSANGLQEIVNIEVIGEQEIVGISTSTHTYICEGFGAHNSVAEHSVIVSKICERGVAKEALFHDASEAYIADISSPFKPYLTNYREIEKLIMDRVAMKFELSEDSAVWEYVKWADLAALYCEAQVLVPSGGKDWGWTDNEYFQNAVNRFHSLERRNILTISCMSPLEAKNAFLERYLELTQ